MQSQIEHEVKYKIEQLKIAEDLEKQGTHYIVRRATLWRRCANMAEALVQEETETRLWQRHFQDAAAAVYGNKEMY